MNLKRGITVAIVAIALQCFKVTGQRAAAVAEEPADVAVHRSRTIRIPFGRRQVMEGEECAGSNDDKSEDKLHAKGKCGTQHGHIETTKLRHGKGHKSKHKGEGSGSADSSSGKGDRSWKSADADTSLDDQPISKGAKGKHRSQRVREWEKVIIEEIFGYETDFVDEENDFFSFDYGRGSGSYETEAAKHHRSGKRASGREAPGGKGKPEEGSHGLSASKKSGNSHEYRHYNSEKSWEY